MALKRKELDLEDPQPDKRCRRGIGGFNSEPRSSDSFDGPSDVLMQDTNRGTPKCEEEDDTVQKYRQNGEIRADREARYEWKYVCEFEGCGQRFNRPCRLEDHMRSHTKQRLPCTYEGCDRSFTRPDHLKRHIRSIHSDEPREKKFVCDWEDCGKRFNTGQHLRNHIKTHETKFYCRDYPPCKEVFRKQATLDAHVLAKHHSIDPYVCAFVNEETGERCTKSYKNTSGLRAHEMRCHGQKKDEGYYCFLCPVPGTDLEVVETAAGIVEVPKEPLGFLDAQGLADHKREFHPPKCVECGRTFKQESNLKEHIKTIHGPEEERPKYPCPHAGCGKVLSSASNRKIHIESVHYKQKNFYCDKSFFVGSNKPELANWNGYNACGGLYASKGGLEQHVLVHHLNLPNRKQMRREKKSKAMAPPPVLTLLTGEGDSGGRNLPCLIEGCDRRYFMDRDLRRHLASAAHGLTTAEIEEMMLERSAREGGTFWVGGADQFMFDSTEPSVSQTPVPQTPGFQTPQLLQDLNAMQQASPYFHGAMKPIDPRLDDEFDMNKLSLLQQELDEQAHLDAQMGLTDLETVDASFGLPNSFA